jgi:acetyl-CoA synthetase
MRWPDASRTATPSFVITSDEGPRGGRTIPLKANTDKALEIAAKDGAKVKKVLVVRRTGGEVGWVEGRDVWYHEAADAKPDCPPRE